MSIILNKKLSKNLKENGYIFLPITKINKIFINKVKKIIDEYLSINKDYSFKFRRKKIFKTCF